MISPPAEAQLATIRAEIERYGESIVGCDALLVLVAATDPIGAQFGHIFATAEREHWSFEFRNDGTVRFAALENPDRRSCPRTDVVDGIPAAWKKAAD
jgi:hypothetical protein